MHRDALDQFPHQARFMDGLEIKSDQGFRFTSHASHVNSIFHTIIRLTKEGMNSHIFVWFCVCVDKRRATKGSWTQGGTRKPTRVPSQGLQGFLLFPLILFTHENCNIFYIFLKSFWVKLLVLGTC